MSHQSNPHRPEPESLRTQLAELNSRTRTYTSQLWQVPFAYLATVGVVLTNLKKDDLTIGFFAAFALGALISWHVLAIERGRSRAVADLRRTEEDLGLVPTAEDRPSYTWPFIIATLCASVGFLVAGVMRTWLH